MAIGTITVVTPPESTDLTTTARFKSFMEITSSSDDSFIAMLITQASAFITTYCDREFARQKVIEILRSDGGKYLRPKYYPIISVDNIDYQDEEVDGDDYFVFDPAMPKIVNTDSVWNCTGYKYDYSITYTFGYILTSFASGTLTRESYDLENACIQLVKSAYLTRSLHPGIKREEMPDVRSITYAGGEFPEAGMNLYFSPVVAQILNPYKRMSL